MAPLGQGSPFRPRSRARLRATSTPPPVPQRQPVESTPKNTIDLNSSTRSGDPAFLPGHADITRRSYLCDVVVEYESDETNALLARLGDAVGRVTALSAPSQTTPNTPRKQLDPESSHEDPLAASSGRLEEQQRRMLSLIEELVRTERSYVSRIKALKKNYADPLRHFAKSSSTSIIPVYEAKVLFGNIDAVLPAAELFLADLEEVWASGQADAIVGDVCLKHLTTLKTLDPYRTYISNQDEAQKMFQDMFKRVSRFVSFIDSTKQGTTGIGNIGLRELLMEPVQRIPRYTLLWQAMMKCMSPLSEQRAKLLEATDLASRIARCEADEQTVRATVMYCLQRNVEGFPANLFSNNRDYLDCIDAEDQTTDGVAHVLRSRPRSIIGTASSITSLGVSVSNSMASPQKELVAPPPLHTTLFLFDDKLMITKRQSSTSGRKVTGLDDVQGLVKSGGGVAVKEKDGSRKARLGFRGVVDIMDVMVADLGNGDFLLFLEKPPQDLSERWMIPLRTMSATDPPSTGFHTQGLKTDKQRFLHSVWSAQALSRTKVLPSNPKAVPHVLAATHEVEVEPYRRAKLFWNIWGASAWAAEPKKTKVLIEVVPEDYPKPIGNPADRDVAAIIRLQPMSGDVCFLSMSSLKGDIEHRTMLDLQKDNVDVNQEVAKRIHTLGVYDFPVSNPISTGRTPSTLSRRGARSLFTSGTASSRTGSSDAFDSMSTKGSRSITSRTSTLETNRTVDMRSMSSGRVTPTSPQSLQFPRTPTSPATRSARHSEELDDERPPPPRSKDGHFSNEQLLNTRGSEMNLDARLNEARQNSRSLASLTSPPPNVSRVAAMREEVEARERRSREESDSDLRSLLRSPGARNSSPSKIPVSQSPAKANLIRRAPVPTLASSITGHGDGSITRDSSLSSLPQSPTKALSRSDTMSPRGPRGPAGASTPRSGYKPPLPPPVTTVDLDSPPPVPPKLQSPLPDTPRSPVRPMSAINPPAMVENIAAMGAVASEVPTQTPFSRPLPQVPVAPQTAPSRLTGIDGAPKLRVVSNGRRAAAGGDENVAPGASISQKRQHMADHLSPRKRIPSDSTVSRHSLGLGSAPDSRKASAGRGATPRGSRQSSGTALTPTRRVSAVSVVSIASAASGATDKTICTLSSATDDFDVIMSEHADLPSAADSCREKLASGRKQARSVRRDAAALSKHMSRDRQGEQGTLPRSPARHNVKLLPLYDDFSMSSSTLGGSPGADLARSIVVNSEALETILSHALADTERVRMLARQAADNASLVTALQGQLERAKEREDLIRSQLSAKEMEVDEIYNAFNAELDGMYNDITLPTPTDVEAALRRDLQSAKAKRNELDLENIRLRQQLEEERLQRKQMGRVVGAETAWE